MASPVNTDFADTILDIVEQSYSKSQLDRLWLGGTAGPSGGQGLRPGGFIGQLIQTMSAYDTTEAATPSGSSSLWDNLNHIRYNIAQIDSAIASGVASTFLQLLDTPDSYTGQAGKTLIVNDGETGLEFTTASTGNGSTHVHEITRWSVASGTSSLLLPDYVYQVLNLTNNGLTVDPLDYTLVDYTTINLSSAVVTDTIFTAQYILLSE